MIHTQVVKFHDIFRQAKSLDEMIECHDEQCVWNSMNLLSCPDSAHPAFKKYKDAVFFDQMCALVCDIYI